MQRFVSRVATLVVAVVACGLTGDRGGDANACGWSPPLMEEITSFDPAVAGETADVGLEYDLNTVGVGKRCEQCDRQAMLTDWGTYLGGKLSPAELSQVLFRVGGQELQVLETALEAAVETGAAVPASLTFVDVALKQDIGLRSRLMRAFRVLGLAREIEAMATLESTYPEREVERLLTSARRGMITAKQERDAFIAQRFAFLGLRVAFYARRWGDVRYAVERSPELAGPSQDLTWRARYYRAGALRRSGDVPGANLELARIHAGYPALSGVTVSDFRPQEDADWREALRRAGDPHSQTLLWRMVGLILDPELAAREIYRLEPTSPLIGLLVVRELTRAESRDDWKVTHSAYQRLEEFVARVASTPGADRPWLMDLVGGHLAAKRGDVELAQQRLDRARAARPDDLAVARQAQASWALALVHRGGLDSPSLEQVATATRVLSPEFTRRGSVVAEVRGHLGQNLQRAGRGVDAEFVVPDTYPRPWQDQAFLRRMLERIDRSKSEYDRFVLEHSYTKTSLEQEIALQQLMAGQFLQAAKFLATRSAGEALLVADPFTTRIKDCFECENGGGPWTLRAFAEELRRLQVDAQGVGDEAARSALAIGTALYNLTRHGNNRSLVGETHQETWDASAAERWYRRAYRLAQDRELKAQAAFYAAKAERAVGIAKRIGDAKSLDPLPTPEQWYPVVRRFEDTEYHRQVLAECGDYRTWLAKVAGSNVSSRREPAR